MGIVTSAVYDRPKSAARALGFCECQKLQELFLRDKEGFALIRSTTSRNYRVVRLVGLV